MRQIIKQFRIVNNQSEYNINKISINIHASIIKKVFNVKIKLKTKIHYDTQIRLFIFKIQSINYRLNFYIQKQNILFEYVIQYKIRYINIIYF